MNPREVLGVNASASKSEIKQAFRKAAQEVHPDHSNSPEAAEAFARIKEAHDALLKEAETPRESVTATATAAHAAAATAKVAFTPTPVPTLTDEEIAHIQELDEAVRESLKKKTLFKRAKESVEVRQHKRKLKTNERRLRGLY